MLVSLTDNQKSPTAGVLKSKRYKNEEALSCFHVIVLSLIDAELDESGDGPHQFTRAMPHRSSMVDVPEARKDIVAEVHVVSVMLDCRADITEMY